MEQNCNNNIVGGGSTLRYSKSFSLAALCHWYIATYPVRDKNGIEDKYRRARPSIDIGLRSDK
jgi:hypothetical protein